MVSRQLQFFALCGKTYLIIIMRKTLFSNLKAMAMLIVMALSVACVTSCSSDDDDEDGGGTEAAQSLVGKKFHYQEGISDVKLDMTDIEFLTDRACFVSKKGYDNTEEDGARYDWTDVYTYTVSGGKVNLNCVGEHNDMFSVALSGKGLKGYTEQDPTDYGLSGSSDNSFVSGKTLKCVFDEKYDLDWLHTEQKVVFDANGTYKHYYTTHTYYRYSNTDRWKESEDTRQWDDVLFDMGIYNYNPETQNITLVTAYGTNASRFRKGEVNVYKKTSGGWENMGYTFNF